LMCRYPPC